MANKYFVLSISPASLFFADIKSAFIDKYGAGAVTIDYEGASDLIFHYSGFADKVIKINYGNLRLQAYYGDAWTSGTTITNQVQFAGAGTSTSTEAHLILGDNFILFNTLQGAIISALVLCGKLSNGNFIVFGCAGSASVTYNSNSIGKNTTEDTYTFSATLGTSFNAGGKLYKLPVYFDGEINLDGTPAFIEGLFSVSYVTSTSTILKGANYLMTTSPMYMAGAKQVLQTPMFVEF